MTIFGVRILFEKTYQAELDRTADECSTLLVASEEQLEYWPRANGADVEVTRG